MASNDPKYYKSLLTTLYPCKVPFTVVIKEDKPKKRLGTYYGKTRRIIIHTGWASKHDPVETAIHEYAHHLHYTEYDKTKKKHAPHGKEYWQIYGQLMNRAKVLGICDYELSPSLLFPESSPQAGLKVNKQTSLWAEANEPTGRQTITAGMTTVKRFLKDALLSIVIWLNRD